MGCDGGTIPRRDELVRLKKKPEQKDKESELSFRWRHCTITQQPLQQPIVACGLGRLYSKESILEGLLDRSKLPETSSHVTSLKDVKELVLTPNPAYKREQGGEKGESGRYVDHRTSPYACPVIGMELSGKFRFVFSWNCGCVISEKAIKEVPSKFCHKCQSPFEEEDLVYLNAEGELLELMQTQMESRKLRAKMNKKGKKNKQSSTVTSTFVKPSTSQNIQFFAKDTEDPSCSKSEPSECKILISTDDSKNLPESNSTLPETLEPNKTIPVIETKSEETSTALAESKPESKVVDTKVPESKLIDAKVPDSKLMDTKLADIKEPESKTAERKESESRSAERKELESRSAERKEPESRSAERKEPESRSAERKDTKRSHSSDSKHREEHRSSSHHRKSSRDRRDRESSRNHHKSHTKERRSSRDRKSHEHRGNLDSIADPAYKKAKLDYSVAKDPKATNVYKSLFTSHENAKSQTKAHWVTYNPFYN